MMTPYGEAIRAGFRYVLDEDDSVIVLGQGLWSPWYVGNTMRDLEKEFGKERVIDTPVSELACTGAAVGAALCGLRPIVTHPRVDFAMLAMDQMVNQAAKWNSMFGGRSLRAGGVPAHREPRRGTGRPTQPEPVFLVRPRPRAPGGRSGDAAGRPGSARRGGVVR